MTMKVIKLASSISSCILCLIILQSTSGRADVGHPSTARIAAQVQDGLLALHERAEELKYSLPTGRRINYLMDNDIPFFMAKVKNLNAQLKVDGNLSQILANFQRYSDPDKELWFQMNQTSTIAHDFLFKNVFIQLQKLDKEYKKLLKNEPDKDNSALTQGFITDLRAKIGAFFTQEFNLAAPAKNSELPQDQENQLDSNSKLNLPAADQPAAPGKMNINQLITFCKDLLNRIIGHELGAVAAIKRRKRRAAAGAGIEASPCTTFNSDWTPSPSARILHQSESFTVDIPITVTYSLFTIQQLYSAELILKTLLLCYDDDSEVKQLEDFIKTTENELASTVLESESKFNNATLTTSTIDGRDVVSTDGGKVEAFHTVWMCDPKEFFLGGNVFRFSGVLQTCIERESDLNDYGHCSGKCGYYKQSPAERDFGVDLVRARFAQERQGRGGNFDNLPKCARLEGQVQICSSNARDKRYEWYSAKGEVFGKKYDSSSDSCRGDLTTLNEEWEMEIGSPLMKSAQFCEICLCTCNYLPPDKTPLMYILIREVSTDVASNMVMTGIRFEVQQGVLLVAIEQGKILKDDKIDESTLFWKTAPFTLPGETHYDPAQFLKLNSDFQKIHLDDIQLLQPGQDSKGNRNFYATGVRFQHHKDHLQLQLQMTRLDPVAAAMDRKSSIWINAYDDHSERKVLVFNTTDDPIASPKPAEPMAGQAAELSVQFSAADLKSTGGQVVVPYFDGQSIHPVKRGPISGVGLFYKGQAGYGGFLAWRLVLVRPENAAK